jgi:hypothetical protein
MKNYLWLTVAFLAGCGGDQIVNLPPTPTPLRSYVVESQKNGKIYVVIVDDRTVTVTDQTSKKVRTYTILSEED